MGHLEELAVRLDEAWMAATTIAAPSRSQPGFTLDDAYEVQRRLIDRRVQAGSRAVGWKLGLTSAGPGQDPIYGVILDDMVVTDGSAVAMGPLIAPRIEGEIAVRMAEPVAAGDDPASIAAGSHLIAPALEIIDYRTADHQGPVDWVADNSTIAHAVLGEFMPLAGHTPSELHVTLERDEKVVATGAGSLAMGDPLGAVVWLAQRLAQLGRRLEPGDLVLTGSLTGNHAVAAGESWSADFGALGSVGVRFQG